MSVSVFRCYSPDLNFVLFSKSNHLSFELAAIVTLKYLVTSERTEYTSTYSCIMYRWACTTGQIYAFH